MLFAESDQPIRTLNTQASLQRSWFVVDAGMNDPAVVPRLVHPDGRLLLKDGYPALAPDLEESHGYSKTDDSPTHYDTIKTAFRQTHLDVHLPSRG
jgi:hypothetical protein